MFVSLATITYLICSSCGEDSALKARIETPVALVEVHLRNWLITRNAFPKIPNFWEYTALEVTASKLHKKARTSMFGRIKQKAQFSRTKVKAGAQKVWNYTKKAWNKTVNAVKIGYNKTRNAIRKGWNKTKIGIQKAWNVTKKPLIQFAKEALYELKEAALDWIRYIFGPKGNGIDYMRPGPGEVTTMWEKLTTCRVNPTSFWWSDWCSDWVKDYFYLRSSYSTNLPQKLLNDLADPEYIIRDMILTATETLEERVTLRLQKKQSGHFYMFNREVESVIFALAQIPSLLAVETVNEGD